MAGLVICNGFLLFVEGGGDLTGAAVINEVLTSLFIVSYHTFVHSIVLVLLIPWFCLRAIPKICFFVFIGQ